MSDNSIWFCFELMTNINYTVQVALRLDYLLQLHLSFFIFISEKHFKKSFRMNNLQVVICIYYYTSRFKTTHILLCYL